MLDIRRLPFDNSGTPGFWTLYCLNRGEGHEAFLTQQEQKEYATLGSLQRKKEWFSARVALKKILIETNRIGSPLHCQTEKNRFGCPHVRIGGEGISRTMNCSISHKKGMAAVCISEIPNLKLGIDLETISGKPMQLQKAFAHEDDSLPGLSKAEEHFAVLWACKEAASKAIGLGMAMDFKTMQVQGDLHSNFRISVDGKEAIQGGYLFFQNFVVALCHQISC